MLPRRGVSPPRSVPCCPPSGALVQRICGGRLFRWIPQVNAAALRFLSRQPELLQLLRHADVRSLVAVPLRAGGVILGGIAFARIGSGDQFHAADLAAAQVIARRMEITIRAAELQGQALEERGRRNRLETALQKWIRVFDRAGWGAAVVDGEDQRIEAVNPAFARLHGYPDADSLWRMSRECAS